MNALDVLGLREWARTGRLCSSAVAPMTNALDNCLARTTDGWALLGILAIGEDLHLAADLVSLCQKKKTKGLHLLRFVKKDKRAETSLNQRQKTASHPYKYGQLKLDRGLVEGRGFCAWCVVSRV